MVNFPYPNSMASSNPPACAATHGLPPVSREEDPTKSNKKPNKKNDNKREGMGANAALFQSVWDKPKSFIPYLSIKPIKEDLKRLADLSSGKIWKQLKTLRVKTIGRIDRTADSLMIHVNTAEESDQLLKCKEFCGLSVEVTPHSSLNCSKGVIKNGWLKGSSAKELEEDLDCVIKAEQILIKKGENLVKTGTWILTFNTPTCPAHLDVYWMRIPVRVFIPKPMRCFRCQKFGHLTKHCKAKLETCVRCGAHEKHTDCSKDLKCSNCSGPHAASDKTCPTYKATELILKHRAEHGGTYASSKEALFPGGLSYSAALKRNQRASGQNQNGQNQSSQNVNRSSSRQSNQTDAEGFNLVGRNGKHNPATQTSTTSGSGVSLSPPSGGGDPLSTPSGSGASSPSTSSGGGVLSSSAPTGGGAPSSSAPSDSGVPSPSTSHGAGGPSSSTSSGGGGSSLPSSSRPPSEKHRSKPPGSNTKKKQSGHPTVGTAMKHKDVFGQKGLQPPSPGKNCKSSAFREHHGDLVSALEAPPLVLSCAPLLEGVKGSSMMETGSSAQEDRSIKGKSGRTGTGIKRGIGAGPACKTGVDRGAGAGAPMSQEKLGILNANVKGAVGALLRNVCQNCFTIDTCCQCAFVDASNSM